MDGLTANTLPPATLDHFHADPIGFLTRLRESMPQPQEEMVVVTPSLDALKTLLRAELNTVPFPPILKGLRVLVSHHADEPRVVPASMARFFAPSPFAAAYQDWHALKLVRGAGVEPPATAGEADTPTVVGGEPGRDV